MNKQYKKGVSELCVLSLLHRCDSYGYDIARNLSQYIEITNGTVYQILQRLTNVGLITTNLSEESDGHLRKYYSLTSTGREAYQQKKQEWQTFMDAIDKLLRESDRYKQEEVSG